MKHEQTSKTMMKNCSFTSDRSNR